METVYGYIKSYPHIIGEIIKIEYFSSFCKVFICNAEKFSQLKGYTAWQENEPLVAKYFEQKGLLLPKNCKFVPFGNNSPSLVEIDTPFECLMIELEKELI